MTDSAVDVSTEHSAGDERLDVRGIARAVLESSGGVIGLAAASAPAVGFVVANALGGLTPALVTLAVLAVTAAGVRLARRESLTGVVIGLVVAAVCALVAAVTGEARAFFLLPTLLPIAIMIVCLGSVLVRRPLTGVLLNRMVGGPVDWPARRGLMRVYVVSTLAAVAVDVVNGVVQAIFYLADRPAVLAAAHVATGPVFAALVAATLVAARRRVATEGPAAVPGGCAPGALRQETCRSSPRRVAPSRRSATGRRRRA